MLEEDAANTKVECAWCHKSLDAAAVKCKGEMFTLLYHSQTPIYTCGLDCLKACRQRSIDISKAILGELAQYAFKSSYRHYAEHVRRMPGNTRKNEQLLRRVAKRIMDAIPLNDMDLPDSVIQKVAIYKEQ